MIRPQLSEVMTRTDWYVAAPLLWLAGAAVLVLLADAFRPKRSNNFLLALMGLAGAAIGHLPLFQQASSGDFLAFSGMVRLSTTGLALSLLCLGTTAGAGLLAWNNLDRYERGRHSTALWTLLLLAPIGMLLTIWSEHLAILFLGIETLSLPLYALAALRRGDAGSIEAGLKYFLLGAFASGFLAFGMAALYAGTGSLTTEAVDLALDAGPLAVVGLGMVLIGILFKAGAVPFHLWVADVYQGAPTAVTALMATGTKVVAFGALLRWIPGADVVAPTNWLALGILTLLVANLAALPQTNLKRLLALSGVAHAGILFLALAPQVRSAAGPEWDTVVFYLVAYGLAALAAFGALELLERRAGGTSDIDRLRGLGRREPFVGGVLAVSLLSLAGVPMTAGFLAKYLVFVDLVRSEYWVWALVAVLLTLIAFAYYLRAMVQLFMVDPEDPQGVGTGDAAAAQLDLPAAAAVAVPALLTLLLGVWPALLLGNG